MVVGDIRHGIPVYLFRPFQFFQNPFHSGEIFFMRFYILRELIEVAAIKLYQAPAQQAGDNQLEISRAHG